MNSLSIWQRNISLEIALNRVDGYDTINKFGVATDCDSAVPTDVWDGADGTLSTDVWVPPTQARIHDIASSAVADDGSPVGTGMRTMRVYGLTDWDTAEVTEDIVLDGTTPVPTTNSYVIIHRMHGLTFGSGGTNAGNITATAAAPDSTITAAILIGNGQTLMAIYGVPSIRDLALTEFYSSILTGASGANVLTKLLVNSRPGETDGGYVLKGAANQSDALPLVRRWNPPIHLPGPAIVKIQALSDTNNISTAATFNAYLSDNT